MTGAFADRTRLAVVLIVASVLLLSAADAAVKAMSADYSLWQIYAARAIFSVPVLLLILALGGIGQWFQVVRPWILLRSLLLVGMWIAYYAALPSMDLSVAATALYTTPLFIACFSSLFAGEPVGRTRWIGIAIGFIGVLVILRPGADDFSIWTLLPILAAILYALAAIVTRLRCASESPLVLALGLHLCLLFAGIVGTVSIALFDPPASDNFFLGRWTPMDLRDWAIMAGLGIVMVAIATGVAKAYQIGASSVVGTFDYTYLVFAALWGVLFFSETLDAMTVTGILLIIGAGVIVLRRPRVPVEDAPIPRV
ncbi:MAG: DMT family transporter [Dongiaceae bacterium]